LKKKTAVTLLILMTAAFLVMPLSQVLGQSSVSILLASPQEEGTVGQQVNIQGTIETTNGEFHIYFGNNLVVSNTSDGYYVNTNFTIPELSGGSYAITLNDVSRNVNDSISFTVLTAYYIEAVEPSPPALLQEGSGVTLNVRLTGIQSGTGYSANVTVELPAPLSTRYSRTIELSTTSQGVATGQLIYPTANFQPEGALTNYTGSYTVYLNMTESLAESQFFVGFTDLSQYHRDQTVTIRALGYQPDENATISIKYAETGTSVYSETVTASSGGVITSSWTVPSDALIGDYNITITPEETAKLIPDSQIFTVPGYGVKIRTLNLAGETVPNIVVEARDQGTSKIYNATSASDGVASLNLEKGNHTVIAYWNGVKVGAMNASITGSSSFDLTCELTNLKITVQNENGDSIPFVDLDITFQYVTTKGGSSQTGHASGQTGLSGSYVLNSTLPRIGYTVNASLYEVVFNVGNNTVSSLPVRAVSEVAILCPSRTLTLKIIDYNRASIPNARIELFEVTSGLFHGDTADAAGAVTAEVTFGKYKLRVYKSDILLNETIVEVFSNTQSEIRCNLYNIQVSVKVVDYFQQPIPNVNVMLHGPGIETLSDKTQTGGTATFKNVIGGSMQVVVYPEGMENSYEAVNLQVVEPTTVQIRMAKYILIGPFLVESSVLATIIVIVLAIILFVSIEVYRRKRAKSAK
jgi:hypothetical protein